MSSNNISFSRDKTRRAYDKINNSVSLEDSLNTTKSSIKSDAMLNINSATRSRSPSPSRPLLSSRNAPLANAEKDEDVDDREVVSNPYPGVDDGFFSNGDNEGKHTEESGNPDVELIPVRPRDPEDIEPHIPDITPRIGPDGGSMNPDDPLPPTENPKIPSPENPPEFPQSPGFRPWGWDLEVGRTLPSGETIPDLNVYQHKKTLAQGMMDLALFSANANQMRYVLETFKSHPYYYPSLTLISISLILQVVVGILLVWNASYNVRDERHLCIANKVNNFTTIGVFLVTIINVFISAFGVAPAPS